jgi:hypothetical protein
MTSPATSEEVRKIKAKPLVFCGGFDSDPVSLNGHVKRLHIFSCPELKNGEQMNVIVKILELDRYFNRDGKTIDESSNDDVIATFEGVLHNKNEKFFFSSMRPSKPINWSEKAPYPWFRLAFARENDCVTGKCDNTTDDQTFPVVLGKNDEPPESPEFEIGFMITKEDGTPIGNQEELVSYLYGEYSYQPFLELFDIHTQLDSINLLNITNAQIKYEVPESGLEEKLVPPEPASATWVYDSSNKAYNESKLKAINNALKAIDKLIKESKNPWFQHIQAVNEYYRDLDIYKGHVEQYNRMINSPSYSPNDCFAYEHSIIRPMAQALVSLEKDIHQYLKSNSKPPKDYLDRINRNIAILSRNEKIDKILNNPAVQLMGLLPGSGVVTGMLKLIQGNITEGVLDVFGSIVTYGSFFKLSRVARAYRRSPKPTVELLCSYRYRQLVSSITTTDVMEKITAVSLRQSGNFLGKLFDTVGTFRALKGHVDSIAILHKNRDYIKLMTEKAIKGIYSGTITNATSYLLFLEDLGNLNDAANFFAHIRVLHTLVRGGKDAYEVTLEAMDELEKLLKFDLPGVEKFDIQVIENIRTLFLMMRKNQFKIQEVIDKQTDSFANTSSIIDHFNVSLADYDMFGVNYNADIRYQNTCDDMLLAIDEICDLWASQKRSRDNWIDENKNKYIHHYVPYLQKEWARKTKILWTEKSESLETRIANFKNKLEGQIKAREALREKAELNFLNNTTKEITVYGTNFIYDFDDAFFRSEGTKLVMKYY